MIYARVAGTGSYLPGASGPLTADPFGRVRRVLIWARFSDGLARPLSPLQGCAGGGPGHANVAVGAAGSKRFPYRKR